MKLATKIKVAVAFFLISLCFVFWYVGTANAEVVVYNSSESTLVGGDWEITGTPTYMKGLRVDGNSDQYRYYDLGEGNELTTFQVNITSKYWLVNGDQIYFPFVAFSDTLDDFNNQEESIGIIIEGKISGYGKIYYGIAKNEGGTTTKSSIYTDNQDWNEEGEYMYHTMTVNSTYVLWQLYSDEARTILLSAKALTFDTPASYRYIFWGCNRNIGNPNHLSVKLWNLVVETLDEAVDVVTTYTPDATLETNPITFTYELDLADGAYNASLYLNKSGVWQQVATNATALIDDANNTISYSITASGTYLWNVKVTSDLGETWAADNKTVMFERIEHTPYVGEFWILEFSPGESIQPGITKEFVLSGGNVLGKEYVVRMDINFQVLPYNFTFSWTNDTEEWVQTEGIGDTNRGFTVDNTHSYTATVADANQTVAVMRATMTQEVPTSDPVNVYSRVWNTTGHTAWILSRTRYVGFNREIEPTPSGEGDSGASDTAEDEATKPFEYIDADKDGLPDFMDMDDDNDGIPDIDDPDDDGDGIPDFMEPDLDGDGVPDSQDQDIDGDGLGNGEDYDDDDDGIPDSREADLDGDGIIDDWDGDIDGDGIPNHEDTKPRDKAGTIRVGGILSWLGENAYALFAVAIIGGAILSRKPKKLNLLSG